MPDILEEMATQLYNGEAEMVAELVKEALHQGLAPQQILSAGLIAGMDQVGQDFKVGDIFVPEVLVAARAMQTALEILRPLLAETGVPSSGKCVLGTVQGDLHDIGKNLVKMMLEGAGFEIIDLGSDVRPERFVNAVREHQPDLLGISALLTTTMVNIQIVIDALVEAGVRDAVKIMVGGAPLSAAFAQEIGADGYAPDAATAVDLARELVE